MKRGLGARGLCGGGGGFWIGKEAIRPGVGQSLSPEEQKKRDAAVAAASAAKAAPPPTL